jgi:putative hydrolase of the HAD superfamily
MQQVFQELNLENLIIENFDIFYNKYHPINEKYWARFRNGFITRNDLRWKRMQAVLIEFKKNDVALAKKMSDLYLQFLPLQTSLFENTNEILSYCKSKNYKLHIITNGFEETQKQKLKNSNIDFYFDKIITSEKAMSLKPHKEIFDYAMNTTNAKKENSFIIGDNLEVDILGGKNAGWKQIYFNPNEIKHQEKITFEIKNLIEIKNIL